MSYIQTLCVD